MWSRDLGRKRIMSKPKFLPSTMTSTGALEEQIAALIQRLEEMKETKRLEKEHKEAEAMAEKACLEEECRLQEEEMVRAECKRCDAEECHMEQERQEEEARWRESCQETSPSPVVTPGPELPQKGKEPEVALELEVAEESRRCDSCVRWNMECIRIKVSTSNWMFHLY